jgi:hypothetical protein
VRAPVCPGARASRRLRGRRSAARARPLRSTPLRVLSLSPLGPDYRLRRGPPEAGRPHLLRSLPPPLPSFPPPRSRPRVFTYRGLARIASIGPVISESSTSLFFGSAFPGFFYHEPIRLSPKGKEIEEPRPGSHSFGLRLLRDERSRYCFLCFAHC